MWQRRPEKSWAESCEALKFDSESEDELEDLGKRDNIVLLSKLRIQPAVWGISSKEAWGQIRRLLQ